MNGLPGSRLLAVLLACGVALSACRPKLEGASCRRDVDCPRSQYCEEGVCREGERTPEPDAGAPPEDAGTGAGRPPCEVGEGCSLVMGAAPSSLVVGGSAELTVSVRDGQGTPVPDIPVVLEVAGGPGTLSADGGTTNAGGAFSVTLTAEVAGRRTVTASAAGRFAQVEVSFVPGEWAEARSQLELSPAQLAVGRSAVFSLLLQDALGNPLPDVSVGVVVTGTGNALGASSGKTDPRGRFTTTLSSTVAEAKTVTATAAGRSLTAAVTFQPGPPASVQSAAVVSPPGVGPGEPASLTVTVRDAWGNPVPQHPVSVEVSGEDNQLSPASGSTDAAGAFTATVSSTRAEAKSVVALAGAARATAAFQVVPGPPSAAQSSLSTGVGTLDAGRSTSVVVVLRDVQGNPVEGAPVALSASSTAGTFGGVSGSTGPGGVLATTYRSTRAETLQLVAEAGACRLSVPLVVTPGAPSWADCSLEVTPPGFSAGQGAELLVTARDAFGNPVGGQAVAVSATGADNTLGSAQGTTDGAGQFRTAFSSNRAEPKRLVATVGGVSLARSVTVTPGAPSAARSGVEVAQRSGLPDGQSPRRVTVVVRDALGNAVPGAQVTLSATGGAQAASPVLPTDPEGRAEGTVWSTTPCESTVTARAGGVELGGVSLSFLYPDAAGSTVEAPASAAADGTPVTVRVTAVDASGRPVAGVPVTLAYSGGAVPVPASASTGEDGVASFTLSSTVERSGVLSASAAGVPLSHRPFLALGGQVPLSGSVSGLDGEGLVLAGTGLPDASVPAGATSFAFSSGLSPGRPWQLSIRAQPAGGWCRLEGGSGVVGRANAPVPHVACHPRWTKVVALDGASLALDAEGGLWGWGRNDEGQLGLGDRVDRPVPARVATGVLDMAGGTAHALAVKEDGTLWAWGDNSAGQLGLGDLADRATPQQVGAGFRAASAGASHSLALGTDGTLWAFGDNGHGQLGTGPGPGQGVPAWVGDGFVAVAAGRDHALALKADRTAWAWGRNDSGQLGLGDQVARDVPVQVAADVVRLSAGGDASGAILADGSLWTWGDNASGQLGLGDGLGRSAPAPVGQGFSGLWLGGSHAVATRTDGTAWVWGANGEGQLGLGDTSGRSLPTFLEGGVAAAAAGAGHSLLVRTDGALRVFGDDTRGALGLGSPESARALAQVGSGFTAVATGGTHALGLGSDGSLWAWGANGSGQLGVGDTVARARPVQVGVGFAAAVAGPDFSLGLKSDGSLWAWGANGSGQLGLGDVGARAAPAKVGTGYRRVAAGGTHALGVKLDGSLWAWGANDRGQLGLSDTLPRLSPTLVTTGFREVAAGQSHSLGLAADGTVWAWGANDDGQLGTGDTASQSSPGVVASGLALLAAGGNTSFALSAAGVLWAWGRTDAGQAGLGAGAPRLSPSEVGAGFDAVSVDPGGRHAVGRTTAGQWQSWGDNAEGALCLGSGAGRGAPTDVAAPFSAVAAGGGFSLAVAAGGALWGCGAWEVGQRGTGRALRVTLPREGP